MKITACYIVLNEEDWLALSLKSIYDYVDEIIIVEGAQAGCWRDTVTPEGFSTDGTREIIEEYPDREKKIKYIRHGNAPNQAALRNRYLEELTSFDGIMLQIDGDELYKPEDMLHMQGLVEAMPDHDAFTVVHWHFWRDIHHIKQVALDHSMYAAKIFRINKDLCYHPPESVDLQGFNPSKMLHTPFINMYHFGWARSKKRLIEKVLWTYKRHIQAGRFDELKEYNDKQLIDYIIATNPLFSKDTTNIFQYCGTLPLEREVKARWAEINRRDYE